MDRLAFFLVKAFKAAILLEIGAFTRKLVAEEETSIVVRAALALGEQF